MHIRNQPATQSIRILIVEDEANILKLMKLNLELEGYEVVTSGNGKETLELIKSQKFDLILLDIMLPEINGFEICEQIRIRNKEIGIIFISAKDTAEDRVKGLRLGADDYLTKPFNLQELLLRVNNLVKRSSPQVIKTLSEYSFGENKIDFNRYKAKGIHGDIDLTNKETLLLRLLIEREGEVISRKKILQQVWGYDVFPSTRTIDNFILSFRKYFERNPKKPKYFHSVRGIGYKFTGNDE